VSSLGPNQSGGVFNIPQQRVPKRKGENFSPVNDLYAPYFDVVFYRPEEETGTRESDEMESQGVGALTLREVEATDSIGASKIQLRSTGGGTQILNPQGPDSPMGQLLNYKSNLQITMVSAAALQATLTLQPPYFDAINIIDSRLIKYGSLMEVQWGYINTETNQPEISDKGLFTIVQPSIKFGREVTLTLGGFDTLSTSLRSIDSRREWSRENFENDLLILREIVSKAGTGLVIDDSGVKPESSLRKSKSRSITQATDNWTFFRRLCRQNDVTFTQVGSTVKLSDQEERDLAPRKYRLIWFMQPQKEWDIPMVSFETNPHIGYFAGQGSRGLLTICRDSETGEVRQVENSPVDPGVGQTGEGRAQTAEGSHKKDVVKTAESGSVAAFGKSDDKTSTSAGRVYVQPCGKPNQDEETDRTNREILRNFNTRASALCPGVPGMVPQIITEVANVGKVFSGHYRVMKVVHDIGVGGYTMQIDLLHAASSGDPRSSDTDVRAQTKQGPENPDQPPCPASGELVEPKPGDDATAAASGGA